MGLSFSSIPNGGKDGDVRILFRRRPRPSPGTGGAWEGFIPLRLSTKTCYP